MATVTTPPTEPASTAGPAASRPRNVDGAVAGAVAAAVALAVGELITAFAESWQTLVISVDNWIIDITPGDVARTGIETAGSADKPILIAGTVVLALTIGALLGYRTLTRRWVGAAGFAAFGVIGAVSGIRDPLASSWGSIVTATLAASAGAATLYLLLRVAPPAPVSDAAAAQPIEDPRNPHANRRAFFGWAGAASAFAVASAGAARRLDGKSAAEEARDELLRELPTPPGEAPGGSTGPPGAPVGLEAEIDGLSSLVTSNEDFYRIDTALIVPQVDPADWSLDVTGMVDTPLTLSFDDLRNMEQHDYDVTLSCVSNEIGDDLVGNAQWQGVPLAEILGKAGVQDGATQIVGRSVDDWTAGFPTEVALDGRPSFVALQMNGEPLPIPHGFPARLVVAGLYGYVSATKWLSSIEVTTWEDFDGYWIPRGWSKEGPIKTQSRVDVPRNGATLEAGKEPIAGVAWAGERALSGVEVQVDEGPWQPAELGEELAATSWRQWVLYWDATPGNHRIRVRATDGTDETQTETRRPPAPDGASGWHTIAVEVI